MIDFTPIARPLFASRVRACRCWKGESGRVQMRQLRYLLHKARSTEIGQRYGFSRIADYNTFRRTVPVMAYDKLRPMVMRMIRGEKDVLWPGATRHFAQSSGTSDGKSKYIPITPESLRRNHYQGASDVVAHYLHLYPDSRIFSGKAFILGGSFANELADIPPSACVGDLSATLIQCINPIAGLFRVPDKATALMADWQQKLPALIEKSLRENITNISGVPSWFLTVLRGVIARAGASTIHDVWPNLEVFFHGGISFEPYREQYRAITDPARMRYLETYNASEGFFAVQTSRDSRAMQLLLDIGCFFEFLPLGQSGEEYPEAVMAGQVEQGRVYELLVTSCNGLWRFPIGDTVKIESVEPLTITIAGRTKHFINAFGEELMVYNAEAALTRACGVTGAKVLNFTAAPVYTTDHSRGRHQWLIEFLTPPTGGIEQFADVLDDCLQQENSDYQAKRAHGIFLDRLTITPAAPGLFDRWLASTGKLGGQRKVPRLCNDRRFIDPLLTMNQ